MKIAAVAPSLSSADAVRTVSAKGYYVFPGLVDLHAHVLINAHDMGIHTDSFLRATGVTTPVKYPSANILRSGWLLGEDVIAGETAVADVKYGQGQVALLGVSVQHRAQAHGTFKLLFNSLYAATER